MIGKIDLPFGGYAFSFGSKHKIQAEQDLIQKRATFTLKYMKEKSWGEDVTKLSIDQIMEIRAQSEWKDPK